MISRYMIFDPALGFIAKESERAADSSNEVAEILKG